MLPKVAPFSFGDEPVEADQFVSVMCSVIHGDLPINITWEFNGRPIDSGSDVTITFTGKRMSTLSIDSVTGHHVGNYSCIGSNKAGFNKHTSLLLVNGLLCQKENTRKCA